jgi:DNA-binding LacI/PurR family transcriptional regulator
MANSSITLQEIALRLGISTATVSRALNDKPGVSEATRLRVIQLANKENYAPNDAARGLATAKSHTVAFLTANRSVPLAEDYFYQRVMLGAQQELTRHGYYLIFAAVEMGENVDLASLDLVRAQRSDGVLLAGPEVPARSILNLKALGMPMVLVDNALPRSRVDCVLSEDEEGGYNATSHLLQHGHRKVVVLAGPLSWVSNAARVAGYRAAMAEATLSLLEVHRQETTLESGYSAMQEALKNHPALTAVFAVNDSMALGAMRALREAGRQVPLDVAVVGFDDIEAAAHVEPPLTTVKVNKRQMGEVAARRLVGLMKGDADAAVRSSVATQLLVRASCGCGDVRFQIA